MHSSAVVIRCAISKRSQRLETGCPSVLETALKSSRHTVHFLSWPLSLQNPVKGVLVSCNLCPPKSPNRQWKPDTWHVTGPLLVSAEFSEVYDATRHPATPWFWFLLLLILGLWLVIHWRILFFSASILDAISPFTTHVRFGLQLKLWTWIWTPAADVKGWCVCSWFSDWYCNLNCNQRVV